MPFDDSLLDILACPRPTCRARLTRNGDWLVCTGCALRYPIRENWVELIPEEADGPHSPPGIPAGDSDAHPTPT